jgi:hypothetical protein
LRRVQYAVHEELGVANMMNLKKKLQNPFALIAQGFIGGAILFFATAPSEQQAAQAAPTAESSSFAKIFSA